MSDSLKAAGIGAFLGVLIFTILLMVTPSNLNKYHQALRKCQAELPRDQRCIITAIPDDRGLAMKERE